MPTLIIPAETFIHFRATEKSNKSSLSLCHHAFSPFDLLRFRGYIVYFVLPDVLSLFFLIWRKRGVFLVYWNTETRS